MKSSTVMRASHKQNGDCVLYILFINILVQHVWQFLQAIDEDKLYLSHIIRSVKCLAVSKITKYATKFTIAIYICSYV